MSIRKKTHKKIICQLNNHSNFVKKFSPVDAAPEKDNKSISKNCEYA